MKKLILLCLIVLPMEFIFAQNYWQPIDGSPGGSIIYMRQFSDGTLVGYDGTRSLFRSEDNGTNWIPIEKPTNDFGKIYLCPSNTILVGALVPGNYYKYNWWRSTDNGITWTLLLSNQPFRSVLEPSLGVFIAIRSDCIHTEVHRSTDFGTSWDMVLDNPQSPRTSNPLYWLEYGGALMYSHKTGTFRSTDFGLTWTFFGDAASVFYQTPLGNWLKTDAFGKLYRSDSTAIIWQPCTFVQLPDNGGSGDIGFTALSSTNDGRILTTYNNRLIVSEDDGASFDILTENEEINHLLLPAISSTQTRWFAFRNEGIFYSENEGDQWVFCGNGLENARTLQLATIGKDTLLAQTPNGLWRKDGLFGSWKKYSDIPIVGFLGDPYYFCKGDGHNIMLYNGSRLFYSPDAGNTMQEIPFPKPIFDPKIVFDKAQQRFIVLLRPGIYAYTPGEQNMTNIAPNIVVADIAIHPNGKWFGNIFNNGISHFSFSTNGGVTWETHNTLNDIVYSTCISPNGQVGVNYAGKMRLSNDGGVTFDDQALSNVNVLSTNPANRWFAIVSNTAHLLSAASSSSLTWDTLPKPEIQGGVLFHYSDEVGFSYVCTNGTLESVLPKIYKSGAPLDNVSHTIPVPDPIVAEYLIAPNPVTDMLSVKNLGNQDALMCNLSVFDALGRSVLSQQMSNATEMNIVVQHLPDGVYSLHISDFNGGEARFIGRFVVIKR